MITSRSRREKGHEVDVIVIADTRVDPRAVMIHLLDAAPATVHNTVSHVCLDVCWCIGRRKVCSN